MICGAPQTNLPTVPARGSEQDCTGLTSELSYAIRLLFSPGWAYRAVLQKAWASRHARLIIRATRTSPDPSYPAKRPSPTLGRENAGPRPPEIELRGSSDGSLSEEKTSQRAGRKRTASRSQTESAVPRSALGLRRQPGDCHRRADPLFPYRLW